MLIYLVSNLRSRRGAASRFSCRAGPRRRLDAVPPAAILSGTPGQDWGIVRMLASLILSILGSPWVD